MSYSVVILTAGIGSRLNNLTKNINKSLVSVANRPVISHIIDNFQKRANLLLHWDIRGN